jgi:hypothetical protein
VGRGHFVAQYLKDLTPALVTAYHSAGVTVVLISETTGQRSLGGRAAGIVDARIAAHQADVLGAPGDTAIYFAEDDFDVTAQQVAQVVAYMLGVKSVLGSRTGFYGGIRPLAAVAQAGAASYLWQTYAWSGGRWDPRAALEQYLNGQLLAGTGVDLDRAVNAFGGWAPPAPRPVVHPPVAKPPVVKNPPPRPVPPRMTPPKKAPPEPITAHPIRPPVPPVFVPPAKAPTTTSGPPAPPAAPVRPVHTPVRLAWWERALDSILRLLGL